MGSFSFSRMWPLADSHKLCCIFTLLTWAAVMVGGVCVLLSVYIFKWVCMCVCVCVCVCIQKRLSLFMWRCVYICFWVSLCEWVFACLRTCIQRHPCISFSPTHKGNIGWPNVDYICADPLIFYFITTCCSVKNACLLLIYYNEKHNYRLYSQPTAPSKLAETLELRNGNSHI